MAFWKDISILFGLSIILFVIVWFLFYQLLKDVTVEGIGKSIGEINEEFDRGFTSSNSSRLLEE